MIYNVKVKPGAGQDEVIKTGEREFLVRTKARPEKGEANAAVLNLLAKFLKVPARALQLKRGAKGRQKLVELLELK